MPGIGHTMNVAKSALQAQMYGINVVSHNIANVNTDSYSRQTVPQEARSPVPFAGFFFGTGVDVQEIRRSADQFLEDRLIGNKSDLAAYEQSDVYMQILEGQFNENTEGSLSALISDFWNVWNELSNNPTGSTERIAVYQQGIALAEQFGYLEGEVAQLNTDLTKEVISGVDRVNAITKEIAAINQAMLGIEVGGRKANDQRDTRNALVSELGEYIDIQTFEQPNGLITILTAAGNPLVYGNDTWDLGVTAGAVEWIGGTGARVDITDSVSGGKIGGWLAIRDGIAPQITSNLDVFAKELIWAVNTQHSQGVGLEYFSQTVTSTYVPDDSDNLLSLAYGDRIDFSKDFKMWIEDNGTTDPTYKSVEVDMGISTAVIDQASFAGTPDPGGTPPYTYRFTVVNGGLVDDTWDLEDPQIQWERVDDDGLTIAQGVERIQAGTIRVDDASNPGVAGVTFTIGTGTLVAGNTFTLNSDLAGTTPDPIGITIKGQANSILDTYKFVVTQEGQVGTDEVKLNWFNGVEGGSVDLEIPYVLGSDVTVEVDGMKLTFSPGTLLDGETFFITTDQLGNATPQLNSEWHWTMDSFKDQFNRQTSSVKATRTLDGEISFTPSSTGHDITNVTYFNENGFELLNTRITVKDYEALGAADAGIRLNRDANGLWTLQGVTAPEYGAAAIVPAPLDLTVGGVSANPGDTYTFTVTSGGTIGVDPVTIEWTSPTVPGPTIINLPGGGPVPPVAVDGMNLTFNAGQLLTGDTFTVTTDATTGVPAVGSVPGDTGLRMDMDGDGIIDMTVDFVNPVTGAGYVEFDIEQDDGVYSFAFGDENFEDSGMAAALGVNTYFVGSNARDITVNEVLKDTNNIAAAQINTEERSPVASLSEVILPVTITAGINDTIQFEEGISGTLTATIPTRHLGGVFTTEAELDILAKDIEEAMEQASFHGVDYTVTYDSAENKFVFDADTLTDLEEVNILWGSSTANTTLGFGSADAVIEIPDTSGDGTFGVGDNRNTLAIAEVQFDTLTAAEYSFERFTDNDSTAVTSTLEGYFQRILGNLGLEAASIKRIMDFNDVIVRQITEQRDAISAVSLDEEMISLIQYQHAYTMASKLISVSDEMMRDLVNIR